MGKNKHIVQVVDYTLIKSVWMFNHKSSIVNFIYKTYSRNTQNKDIKYDIIYIKYGGGVNI